MKTGSTDEAGYCLVSSAERDGMRLISVVLGTATAKSRIDGSQAMLNYGFRFHETKSVFKSEQEITEARSWKTLSETVTLGISEDLNLTLPRGSFDNLSIENNIQSEIIGPIEKGQILGELIVKLNDSIIATQPLIALDTNPTGTLWQQIKDTMQLWFE